MDSSCANNALRAVLVLSYASIVLSVGIFALSMRGVGLVSLFTGPLLAVFTFVYHIAIFAHHYGWCGVRRRRKTSNSNSEGEYDYYYPGATTAGIVLAFLLAQFWMLPEVLILASIPSSSSSSSNVDLRKGGGIIIAVLFVCHTFEVAVMVAVAVLSMLLGHRNLAGKMDVSTKVHHDASSI